MSTECGVKVIKVIGYIDGYVSTRIIEEANKATYKEATEFINSHPHENVVWKIVPFMFEKSDFLL